MKRILALLLAALLLFAFAACTEEEQKTAGETAEPASSSPAETDDPGAGFSQIANPWSEAETLAEAAEQAKVGTFLAPIPAEGESVFRWMKGLAEAQTVFSDGSRIVFRKGVKTESGDISGDYNVYSVRWTEDVDGLAVACAGNAEGRVSLATWTADHDYSISCDDTALTLEELRAFVKGIN